MTTNENPNRAPRSLRSELLGALGRRPVRGGEPSPLLCRIGGFDVERAIWIAPGLIVARLRMPGRAWARFYLSFDRDPVWILYRTAKTRREAATLSE